MKRREPKNCHSSFALILAVFFTLFIRLRSLSIVTLFPSLSQYRQWVVRERHSNDHSSVQMNWHLFLYLSLSPFQLSNWLSSVSNIISLSLVRLWNIKRSRENEEEWSILSLHSLLNPFPVHDSSSLSLFSLWLIIARNSEKRIKWEKNNSLHPSSTLLSNFFVSLLVSILSLHCCRWKYCLSFLSLTHSSMDRKGEGHLERGRWGNTRQRMKISCNSSHSLCSTFFSSISFPSLSILFFPSSFSFSLSINNE